MLRVLVSHFTRSTFASEGVDQGENDAHPLQLSLQCASSTMRLRCKLSV